MKPVLLLALCVLLPTAFTSAQSVRVERLKPGVIACRAYGQFLGNYHGSFPNSTGGNERASIRT